MFYNNIRLVSTLVEIICVHTLMLGQVLVLRTVIRQRVDGRSEILLLLAGAVGVMGRGAVTGGHL